MTFMGQPESLGRVVSRPRLGIANGLKQVRKEWPLRMPRLVLTLRVEGRDIGVITGIGSILTCSP
jgi:hypothetical protein